MRDLERIVNTLALTVAAQQQQILNLQEMVKTLVTKAEFIPVKMIAFGLAGSVLASVCAALLARVVIK